jgi:hypothetical protein
MIENVQSTDAKMPFEGKGCWGYDNHKKKFVGVWIDTWSTSIMNCEGTFDEAKRTMNWESECYCPVMENNMKTRETCVLRADGSVHREFFANMGGQEMKMMELTYTRAK